MSKNKNGFNKGKIITVLLIILVISIILIFFIKNNNKILNNGNNMSNKSIEEIEEYILNISSYQAEIEVSIQSNKNNNKYKLEQKYTSPNIEKQTVLEPSNIAGLETIYDGSNLKISNSKISASTIYENYSYITENFLWLNSFIEDYKKGKEQNNSSIVEENGIICMETKLENNNPYICYKKLYVDKNLGKPTKLCVQDKNKKNLVYILYNEIKFNGLQRDEVLAFKINEQYISQF